MLRKNLPLYILVVLTLAAILFLSPKIVELISADTEISTPQGKEMLTNSQFDQQAFDDKAWSFISSDSNSTVGQSGETINIVCGKAEGEFAKLSQKTPLLGGKFYKLQISYVNENISQGVNAQFGFLKDSASGNVIESKAIEFSPDQTSFTAYSAPKFDHPESYFFFKCTGNSSISIRGFSVEEFNLRPVTMTTINANSTASASSTASATASPSLSLTPATRQFASPAPSLTQTTQPATPTLTGNQTTIKSSWNVFGSTNDISSNILSSKNMTAMQMLSGKWTKITPTSKKSAIFSHQATTYVFNPSRTSQTIIISEPSSPSTLIAGRGWNALYNSSDNETSIGDLKYDFSDKNQTGLFSLGELLSQNKASKDVYLLKQTSNGIGLTKIDLTKTNKIPAKTGFWFYIFSL